MMRVIKGAVLLGMATLLLSALSLKTTTGTKAAPTSATVLAAPQNQDSALSCARWSVVPSPNVTTFSVNGLSGVAAVSARDVWAVGGSGTQRSGAQTLIEHWNGTQWQIVPSPNPSARYDTLYSVAAVSGHDVWAVGLDANDMGVTHTLIEHWNGAHWQVVPSPNPGSQNNELFSVAAVSARDVWAVGFIDNAPSGDQTPVDQTLIEHWNGSHWSVVRSPNPGTSNNHLEGVAAVSSHDVWAVGTGVTAAGQTLVEHWNGTRWQVVTSPSPSSGGDLRGVAAVSRHDVWAAGYYVTTNVQTLTEHWNGAHWQVVPSANVGTSPAFWGVAAASAHDAWVVGSDFDSSGAIQTLTEHWNGSQWRVVASPSPGSFNSQLVGAAVISAHNVWAVGHADGATLIEHYSC